ncbi:MAG TPA: enolase C-terminal domain-like protein [Lichenihabitans sp.]|nr:enolase C-terminal domain-like protein [Lichenihabitans sp.]
MAESRLGEGVKAMKIWPFDQFAPTLAGPAQSRAPMTIWGAQSAAGVLGQRIETDDLKAGIAIVADIRRAAGDRMAIAIEGHARWGLPAATRIARALEPYDILWLEEIMPPDNVESYVRLKAETAIPICQSERVFTRAARARHAPA